MCKNSVSTPVQGLKLLVALLILLVTTMTSNQYAIAEEITTKTFFSEYAQVTARFPNLDDCFIEMMIKDSRGDQMRNYADFWNAYAVRECNDMLESQKKSMLDRIDQGLSDEEYKRALKHSIDDISNCRQTVYFDNWDKINGGITENPEICTPAWAELRYVFILHSIKGEIPDHDNELHNQSVQIMKFLLEGGPRAEATMKALRDSSDNQ